MQDTKHWNKQGTPDTRLDTETTALSFAPEKPICNLYRRGWAISRLLLSKSHALTRSADKTCDHMRQLPQPSLKWRTPGSREFSATRNTRQSSCGYRLNTRACFWKLLATFLFIRTIVSLLPAVKIFFISKNMGTFLLIET